MSRAKTKVGRYTKQRHKENKQQLANIEMKKIMVPYLSIYSDSQDMIIICHQSFRDLLVENWALEVENFNHIFSRALHSMSSGIYTKQEYMDVLEVTGIEIDDRSSYTRFIEIFIEVLYKRIMRCLRRLPGLNQLNHKDFYKTILSHKENLCVLIEVASKANWTPEGLAFQLGNQRSVLLPSDYMVKMTDKEIAESQHKRGIKLTEVNLKFEEAIFLTTIFMLSPTKCQPHFQDFYQRFMFAFTKYLEENYGSNYHLRLQKLISTIAFFREDNLRQKKWVKNNEEYFTKMYKTDLLKAFSVIDDLDEGVEILSRLDI
ncbi:unnamed protein product [Dimorphilus gyrociliatus]|uniref:Uncharacterized protein n=1 Tax=Dimorphilus gyrociliatus TaxID=2664684 RepID=A0A7I8VRS4_9ANNE|nr:unnamed protein product [Dimorphilus gyrociliatus]